MYKSEKEKLEHIKRTFLKSRKLGIISITRRCNLCCAYCREKLDDWYDVLSQKALNLDLKKEDFGDLLDICKKQDFAEVLLTGGEPLEYPHLGELLLLLHKNDINFSIHTNGFSKNWTKTFSLLNKDNIKPNIHLSSELFSVLQKKIRKTDKMPIALAKKASSYGMSVELKVTIHKGIMPYIDKIEKSLLNWKKYGVRSVRFQPVVSASSNFPKELILDKSSIVIFEKLKDIKKNNKELSEIIRNTLDSFETIISFLKGSQYYKEKARVCDIKNKILFVDTDLTLKNCMSLWGKDAKKKCEHVFDLVCCSFQ